MILAANYLPTSLQINTKTMKQSNPLSDFIQFIIGGCFFAAGVFLLSNQVMVRAPMAIGSAVRSGYVGVGVLDLHSRGEALGWDCYYSHLELAFAWRSQVFMPGGQSF